MNVDDAATKLKLDPSGLPIVTLMRDPDGAGAFLSVVERGANGRRIAVTKAAPPDGNDPVNAVGPFLGGDGAPRTNGLLARLFAPLLALFGSAAGVEKSDGPTTFNAAIQAPKLGELLWQAGDALRDTIRNIMADASIADKGSAFATALDQHRAYLLAELAKVPVAKSAEVAALLPTVADVEKAGKMLSSRNAAQVRAARDALTALLAAAGAEVEGEVPGSQVAKEANVLDVAQLTQVAEAAGRSAIAVAKAANPTITPADLVRIGQDATAAVFKAAVQGPPQPALPTGELARQISEATPGAGSPANPTDAFSTAIAGLRADVMKRFDDLAARQAKLETEAEESRAVVAKSLDVVRRVARIPDPPKGGGADGAGAGGGSTTVEKTDVDYSGSGLSFADLG